MRRGAVQGTCAWLGKATVTRIAISADTESMGLPTPIACEMMPVPRNAVAQDWSGGVAWPDQDPVSGPDRFPLVVLPKALDDHHGSGLRPGRSRLAIGAQLFNQP